MRQLIINRFSKFKICLFTGLLILASTYPTLSQDTQLNYWQLWFDFFGHYTFNNGLRYSAEIGPRTIINDPNGWKKYEFSNTFGYNTVSWLDVLGGLSLTHTQETDTTDEYNNYDIVPWLGVLFDINPNSKFWISDRLRMDYRYTQYPNTNSHSSSFRLRNLVSLIYSINGPNFHQDKLWYLKGSFEYFYPLNQVPQERFANQATLKLGIGYRNNYTWRYEIVFHERFTKNTIDEGFSSANSVFNLRLVCFLLPKPKNDP